MIDYREMIKNARDDIEKAYWVGRMREFEDWKLFSEEKPTEAKKYLVVTDAGNLRLLKYCPEFECFISETSCVVRVESWKEVV